MKFGRMTDSDIGKNPLNFVHDPDYDYGSEIQKKYFQFQERNLLFQEHNLWIMWTLGAHRSEERSDVNEIPYCV